MLLFGGSARDLILLFLLAVCIFLSRFLTKNLDSTASEGRTYARSTRTIIFGPWPRTKFLAMEEPLAVSNLGGRITAFNVLDLKSPLERGDRLQWGVFMFYNYMGDCFDGLSCL